MPCVIKIGGNNGIRFHLKVGILGFQKIAVANSKYKIVYVSISLLLNHAPK